MKEKYSSNKRISEDVKELVITRIEAAPAHLKLSIGSDGRLTKGQMIEHVKKGDEVGKKIVNSHLSFLKAIASGEFVKTISSVELD